MARVLFGPCDDPAFRDRFLRAACESGAWATFGAHCPDYATAARGLGGGAPDALVVWGAYASVPAWAWAAPVPVVLAAPDANLLWPVYRHLAPLADLVLADAPTVARLRRAGVEHARPANLFGLDRHFAALASDEWAEQGRDIDVLFVGNPHPAVQGPRLPWVARVAQLAAQYRVLVTCGVTGAEYAAFVRRAKIVANRSARSECNLRALEAAAGGAVLVQERENEEIADYLEPNTEFVPYAGAQFESVVEGLLADGARRARIARAARERARWYAFEALVRVGLSARGKGWDAVTDRMHARLKRGARASASAVPLAGRVWARASLSGPDADLTLAADLARAGERHALGVLARTPAEAEAHFAAASAGTNGNRVSAVGRAAALAEVGRTAEALAVLRAVAEQLEAAPELTEREADSVPYPNRFDHLRVGWTRAGFEHPDDPKAERSARARLLRGRALELLAGITGEVADWERAGAVVPEWPHLSAGLGRALVRAGCASEAVAPLRAALAGNPFDAATAVELHAALVTSGDTEGATALRAERAVLARGAPTLAAPIPEPKSASTPAPEPEPAERPAVVEIAPVAVAIRAGDAPAPELAPDEPLAAPAPAPELAPAPASDVRLVSILILCCNEVEVTKLCLESLRAHTRAPYELVVIDNGSTDGTAEYLHATARLPGPERVTVAINSTNRGYPAGVNQALGAARGELVVMLNNDVVVTPHWLERLSACLDRGGPTRGLVGAVTNYAPPPQLVEPGYDTLAALDPFAEARAARFAGQELVVARATGFCLLARRSALDAVGALDERFGLGFFDDDDLCLRARRAGFGIAVALDCYVHHFGSTTFRALGVDTAAQLAQNLALYQAKWGADEAAKYRAPAPAPLAPGARVPQPSAVTVAPALLAAPPALTFAPFPAAPAPRVPVPAVVGKPRVSLTMIVRNEEANLGACLETVRDLVDEAVVIDTGSADRTVEIARAFDCKVGSFPWIDHFAAARNAALDAATGDYALWMDADDRLDPPDRAALRELLGALPAGNAAFVMSCLCPGEPGSGAAGTAVDHVRLFRLHPAHRWTYRVHEQILPALRATDAEVRWTNVKVRHVGYLDPALRRRKLDRDLRLLELDATERPDDPFTLFNLGSVYHERGDWDRAESALARSLAGSHPKDSIVRKAHALVARCRHARRDLSGAAEAARAGRHHYPHDAELLFLAAGYAREAGDVRGAEALYRELIDGSEGPHFGSADTGLRAVKGRHNLAVMLLEQGRSREAEGLWRAALTHDPGFVPAQVGLGEACVAEGNGAGVLRQAAALEELGEAGVAEAAVLRARWKAADGDRAGALDLLRGAVAAHPRSVGLRVALSHALIAASAPVEELEAAFRGVLEVDPANTQARHNLEVALRNTGRWVEGVLDGSGA